MIEVLSEEPFDRAEGEDELDPFGLNEISYAITQGHCSGTVKATVENEAKTGPEMAKLMEAQGSDPGFFELTDDGEDSED
jgi:hypothetical protein